MLTYALAVLAACANATSSVLQRKANRAAPKKDNLSWKLIGDLLHQPVWFGGILAITVGFLLQAVALGTGSLAAGEMATDSLEADGMAADGMSSGEITADDTSGAA